VVHLPKRACSPRPRDGGPCADPQSQIQLSQTSVRGIVFGRCGGILGLRAALEPDERDTAAGLSIGVAKADGMSHHNSACVASRPLRLDH
jgi:hypothetical protein